MSRSRGDVPRSVCVRLGPLGIAIAIGIAIDSPRRDTYSIAPQADVKSFAAAARLGSARLDTDTDTDTDGVTAGTRATGWKVDHLGVSPSVPGRRHHAIAVRSHAAVNREVEQPVGSTVRASLNPASRSLAR